MIRLKDITNRELQSEQYRVDKENNLIKDGLLIKLSNGVVIKRSNNLIIVEQAKNTIIMNSEDASEIIAFLEN